MFLNINCFYSILFTGCSSSIYWTSSWTHQTEETVWQSPCRQPGTANNELISYFRNECYFCSSNWRPLCKKGVYRFLANFHFFQDQANFWQTDLFWHEKHRSVICFGRFALHSPEITYAKNSVLLLNEKQKKPFVSLSFITRIITLISLLLLH